MESVKILVDAKAGIKMKQYCTINRNSTDIGDGKLD